MGGQNAGADLRLAALQREAVAFLRGWLPEVAKAAYRDMIREDPVNWCRHPHFSNGVIVKHALRGNGIDECALGIPDLNAIWPDLLKAAIELDPGDTTA